MMRTGALSGKLQVAGRRAQSFSCPRPIRGVSPNSVSTLWGSYGMSKEWCPSRCPSATAAFDCAGSQRVPFATTVSHRLVAAGFLVVLPGVRARFEAKRGFT